MAVMLDLVPWARAHIWSLQGALLSWWSHQKHLLWKWLLQEETRASLSWWLDPRKLEEGMTFELPFWMVVSTDASLMGWGIHCQSQVAQGQWSLEESTGPPITWS